MVRMGGISYGVGTEGPGTPGNRPGGRTTRPPGRVVLGGRAVHLLVGTDGVHGTRLGNNLVEKVLGTVATTRNPTVLRTLVERWC